MGVIFSSTYTYNQLDNIIQLYADTLKKQQVITFTGGLGAGKTTFIRHLLTHWGVQESCITSPTFTYVNIYKNSENVTFYHFDLYRLSTVQEFAMAGFNEYLYAPHSIALIEWPEPILPILQTSVAHCTFEYGQEIDERRLTIMMV